MQVRNGEEKRRSPRIHIPVYIETFAESFLAGTLVNLSADGMFIQSTEPKEVGTQMDLRFQLPESEDPVLLAAEVIWVNHPPSLAEEPGYVQPGRPVPYNPGMGLKILSVDPKSRSLLETFLQSHEEEEGTG